MKRGSGVYEAVSRDAILARYRHYFTLPESKQLRFGQWYYSTYLSGAPWPELFYEAEHGVALEILLKSSRTHKP